MQLSARFVVYSSLVGWIVSTSNGMRSLNNASWSTQAFQLSRYRHPYPPRRVGGQLSLLLTKCNGDIFLPTEERPPRGSWPSTVLILRGGDSGDGWMTRRRKSPRRGRLEPAAAALPHQHNKPLYGSANNGKNNRRLSSQSPRHAATTAIATTNDNNDADDDDKARRNKNMVLIRTTILGVVAVGVAAHYRQSWTPYFNKQAIQDGTLSLLQKLRHGEDATTAATATPVRAMLLYGLGMCVWESLGLSTIPVETAAGMVFRFHEAAVASIAGKVLGATLAFLAGRTILSSSLDKNKTIATSRLFVLLRSKNTHHPLLTAALMKFSILPELVKNLGCSVLPQIKLWMFLSATMLHGGGFSLLWTWLGTSMRLNETSRALRATLIIGAFIGGVLTPITMAWWIRALQAMSSASEEENKNQLDMTTTSRITGIGGAVTVARQRIDAYLVRPTSLAEMWIGGLCLASIVAIVMAQKVVE
jgi:uncharacterized membrane protein YdjX (TVP38/TMEM64 family)